SRIHLHEDYTNVQVSRTLPELAATFNSWDLFSRRHNMRVHPLREFIDYINRVREAASFGYRLSDRIRVTLIYMTFSVMRIIGLSPIFNNPKSVTLTYRGKAFPFFFS